MSGDNVSFQSKRPVTPSEGTVIKTELIDGAHFQYVKMDIGASGLSAPVNIDCGLPIQQSVIADPNNSSSANLSASGLFTGASTSTLGVAGIQVSLKTDQNCTVSIEQSPNGTNWDIADEYDYHKAINNFGITVQAINSYYRVKVQSKSATATTYFRLQSALCPVVEALPRSLSVRGNLKAEIYRQEDEYGFSQQYTPMGEARSVVPYRLIGTVFSGSTLDSNFWSGSSGTSGSIISGSGQLRLQTGSSANNTVALQSVRLARYVSGAANRYRAVIKLPDTGTANNTRRWGAFDANNGAFFELATTGAGVSTFGVVTRKSAQDVKVSSGSFNSGNGDTYTLDTSVHTYEIYWTNSKVFFSIDGELIHTVTASSNTWSDTIHLYARAENNNSGGGTSDVGMNIRTAAISRLGFALTQPTSYWQAGQVASVVLKRGPGTLHGISLSGIVVNSVVTLYDDEGTAGRTLWASGAMANNTVPFTIDLKGVPFFVGLTLAITAANSNAMVIYE